MLVLLPHKSFNFKGNGSENQCDQILHHTSDKILLVLSRDQSLNFPVRLQLSAHYKLDAHEDVLHLHFWFLEKGTVLACQHKVDYMISYIVLIKQRLL